MQAKRLVLLIAVAVVAAVSPVALGGAPAGWLGPLALGALLGASPGVIGRRVGLVAMALAAYLGGMALSWSPMGAFGIAATAWLVGAGAFWLGQERATVVVVHTAVLIALALSGLVLARSQLPHAVAQVLTLLGSLSLAGLAALGWLGLVRLARPPRLVPVVAALLCAAGAIVGGVKVPAWRDDAAALITPAQDIQTHVRLQRLRAAGFRDAALAWAGLAADLELEPRFLARICPGRERQVILPPAWRPWVARGEAICAPAHAPAAPDPAAPMFTSWQEWNQALAHWLVRAPARAGVSMHGNDRRYALLLDPELGAYVLTVAADHGVEAHLPAAPHAAAPLALRFTIRATPTFRVVITTERGDRVTHACDPSRAPQATAIDAQACRGQWATLRLDLPREAPLVGVALAGEFALAHVQAELP